MRPVLIPLKPVSSNNLLKYSLNKSELEQFKSNTMPKIKIVRYISLFIYIVKNCNE